MKNPFHSLSLKLQQTVQLLQQVEQAKINQANWESRREALLGQPMLEDAPIPAELLNLQAKIQLGPVQQPLLQRQFETAREELWRECLERQSDYHTLRDEKVDALKRLIATHLQALFHGEAQLNLATENAFHDHEIGRELLGMSLSRAFSLPDVALAMETATTLLANVERLREITIPEKL